MAASPIAVPSLGGYQLRLPVFEGPLDVLLRLIERDQLEISDVSLLAVLDQFLAYIRGLESSSDAVIADFLAVAGRLSVLKSRALLPRPPRAIEEPDESDLVRQLEEYRAVKAAAALLAKRQQDGSGAFGRGDGVATPGPIPVQLAPQPPITLTRAIGRWLTRVPSNPALLVTQRAVSLREMISRISSALGSNRKMSFDRILDRCDTRQDAAVAFLALLVLLRRQAIFAEQNELFGSIVLRRLKVSTPIAAGPGPLSRDRP